MFVIFISHQWLGAPWPNVTTTLTRYTWHEDDFRKIKAILWINNAQVLCVRVVESSWNNGIRNSAFKLPRTLGGMQDIVQMNIELSSLDKKSLMFFFFWGRGYSIVYKVSFFLNMRGGRVYSWDISHYMKSIFCSIPPLFVYLFWHLLPSPWCIPPIRLVSCGRIPCWLPPWGIDARSHWRAIGCFARGLTRPNRWESQGGGGFDVNGHGKRLDAGSASKRQQGRLGRQFWRLPRRWWVFVSE